jgi:hypothetical protein
VGARDPISRRAIASGDDPGAMAEDLARAIGEPAPALVIAFSSWRLEPSATARALTRAFAPTPVIGCTSYGEIGAGGEHEGRIVALALGPRAVRAGIGLAPDLRRQALRSSRAAVTEAAAALDLAPASLDPRRHVAIALVDGRCGVEESFCLGSAATAPQLRFIGGSSSDGVAEPVARVFYGGQAHGDAGVVAILELDVPFAVIASEHMIPTEVRTVVTAADHARRVVHELDGHPARARYQELIETAGGTETVDDVVASSYPFAAYVAGRPYVRSVVRVGRQDLLFACAIETGAVLRLMRPGDLVGKTAEALDDARRAVGGAFSGVLAFSCLGRHYEATTRGCRAELAALYDRLPLVGYHSFGEQIGPLFANHTLTGLALGEAPAPPEAGDG